MLSLWKLRVGAEAYYLSQVAHGIDDYYSGAGESEGRWLGTGSEILNLPEAVTGDDLRAVLAGLVPGTGLSPNGTQIRSFKGRVPGFDLTFSAPKSVSVLYAFGDPLVRSEVTEAVDAAVEAALSWLEREACFVRRGSNNRQAKTAPFEQWGTRRLPGAGFIAAGFRHRTSRAGDPQLHTHVLVANMTCGPDGRWTALDGQALYRSKVTAGTVFQSALRHELSRRLGVAWTPTTDGVADIVGIRRRVLRHFSKRRNEIEAELERSGLSGAAAAADATLATRPSKVDVDQSTLDERWIEDGRSVSFGSVDVDHLLRGTQPIHAAAPLAAGDTVAVRRSSRLHTNDEVEHVSITDFASLVAFQLPEKNARITRHEVQNAVAEQLAEHNDPALLERLTDSVLADPELVPIPNSDVSEAGWEQHWTTRRLLALEADLLDAFVPRRYVGQALKPHLVDCALADRGRSLGPDQADTVRRLCTQGLGVEVVVGRAGTGKTYTMRAVREVFESADRRLVGVCPTARAARELSDGAGIESFTVPRFLRHAQLDGRTIVVVDEAGMCGTIDLHRIVTDARAAGAKIILVGDHHQLPEIAAGGGFRAAFEALGDQRCELTINRRQRHEWEHTALDHLRNGDLPTFWTAFQEHGRVTLADTADDIRTQAIHDWWDSYRSGASAHLIAGTRSEAKLLNRLARSHLDRAGHLRGKPLVVESREFRVSDRVVLLRNAAGQFDCDTRRECRVDNGMIGTVTRIKHRNSTLDIELVNGRRLRLTSDYVRNGHVDHGYATTIHKAQGVTCDEIFVVGPAGLYREAGYVALSRARNSARLYATTRDAAAIGERPHTTGIPNLTENVDDPESDLTRVIAASRGKQFVTSEHPNLARIADLACKHDLADLTSRLRHIRAVVYKLHESGIDDPTTAVAELRLAVEHRQRMHIGGRVNARDWDNVGTIEHINDNAGQATVRFVSETGQATSRHLPWQLLKPIDHPEPAPLNPEAEQLLTSIAREIDEGAERWRQALSQRGIGIDEHDLTRAAVAHREEQLARSLRATPPTWLMWWAGERPTDPNAAVVYDDHIAELARWRDLHRLSDDTPGFGPPPDDLALLDDWRANTDRSLTTRQFLLYASPTRQVIEPIDPASARARLDELDVLLQSAPPDQRLVVDRLIHTAGDDLADVVEALRTAAEQQLTRRDWILEHWPHIVEHHELTTLLAEQDPLAHWPIAPSRNVIELLDQIARRTASDDPERTPLPVLDRLSASDERRAEIERIQTERADLGRALKALDTERPPDEASTRLADDQRARLAERSRDLEVELRRLRAKLTLSRWRLAQEPEIASRIERRIDYLVHEAAQGRDVWLVEILTEASADREILDATGTAERVRRRAASIERRSHVIEPTARYAGRSLLA